MLPGSVDMHAYLRYRQDAVIPEGDAAVELEICGLQGGDSVKDLSLGKGNAIKLMVRFLKHAIIDFEARLAEVEGGGDQAAIPQSCRAVVTVPADIVDELIDEVEYYDEQYRYELRGKESECRFTAKRTTLPSSLIPEEIQDDVINSVEACFDGVLRMSPENPTEIESSSCLVKLSATPESTCASCLIYSVDEELKRYLASMLQSVFVLSGARVSFSLVTG